MLTLWRLCILTCDKLPGPLHFAIFVVLIVVTVKITENYIFWSIMPCSQVSTDASEEHVATFFHTGFLLVLFFNPGDGGDMLL
jgi:hypothetical protein